MTPEKQQAIIFHLKEVIQLMESERTAGNISGWTIAKSGGYFRAFRKIKGRVHGVHLGKSLDDAEQKILTKQSQIQGSES